MRLLLYIVLAIGTYFTVWVGHNQPNTLVWDEHFHIASAQKYLNSIYFQEPHPPVGKLLIALGEKILKADTVHPEFLNFDRSPNTPENFSPTGYRLFPTLFTCAIPLALFDLLLLATSSLVLSFLISLLLVFDLALSTHCRVAHLEAFQIFFILVSISSFLRLRRTEGFSSNKPLLWSAVIGIFFGLSVATKVTSLVVAPLLLFYPGSVKERLLRPLVTITTAVVVFLVTLYVHFSLGSQVQPELDSKGFYGAKENIRPIILSGVSPTTFPIFMSEWVRFFNQYEKGVPKLNLCKTQENGSYPLIWPIGGGTISYSWKKDGETTRYVQLIANPVVWGISLIGFLLGLTHLLHRLITERKPQREFPLSELLTVLYICYYIAMFHVDRVMYLYHALIPMILGLVIFAIRAEKIEYLFGFKLSRVLKSCLGLILILSCIAVYSFFRPLATYQSVTDNEFSSRKWFNIWNLRCANCASDNPIAKPILNGEQKNITKDYWKVEIAGLKSDRIEQEWGEPKTNLDVDSKPLVVGGTEYKQGIGTHARSKIDFTVPKDAKRFEALVGVADQDSADLGSVVFEVRSNSKVLFTSAVIRSGEKAVSVSVPVAPGDKLELFAYDAGDGNSFDHACWLSPGFIY